MSSLCIGISRNPTRRPFDRPTREWLQQKYKVEKLDATQLARIIGCDSKTAWLWLKDAGIETRSRGYGRPDALFKKGQPSAFKGRTLSDESREKIRAKLLQRPVNNGFMVNGVHWLKLPGAVNGRWKGGITPERQSFYHSPEWKLCASTVWRRDKSTCRRCRLSARSIPRPEVDFDLHHIDGFAIVERRADPDNLVLLCEPCHYWIHGKQNTERLFLGRGQ